MSKHVIIRRYTLIIELISRVKYPSLNDIMEFLAKHDMMHSDRTIKRDIERIRMEFDVDVQYSRTQRGYFIDEESQLNLERFVRFLEIVNTAEILTDSLKESKDTLSYLSFESEGDLKGIELLKPMLIAIKQSRVVSFTHEHFYKGSKTQFQLSPYLLKEYQNRWYLVGVVGGETKLKTFGIDRISEFKLSEQTFKKDAKLNPQELFDGAVGLTYSKDHIEEVILALTPFQAKYVKALPIHKSQRVVSETKDEVQMSFHIFPNHEFKQKVLMLGENAYIKKPQWLANELAETLKASLKNYQ